MVGLFWQDVHKPYPLYMLVLKFIQSHLSQLEYYTIHERSISVVAYWVSLLDVLLIKGSSLDLTKCLYVNGYSSFLSLGVACFYYKNEHSSMIDFSLAGSVILSLLMVPLRILF